MQSPSPCRISSEDDDSIGAKWSTINSRKRPRKGGQADATILTYNSIGFTQYELIEIIDQNTALHERVAMQQGQIAKQQTQINQLSDTVRQLKELIEHDECNDRFNTKR